MVQSTLLNLGENLLKHVANKTIRICGDDIDESIGKT